MSITTENALLDAIQSKRYGDALYFWVRMDMDSRNPSQMDFWSFCDAVNAGNCKYDLLNKCVFFLSVDLCFSLPFTFLKI